MQNIFRLDPSMATVSNVEAKYGRQLEEAYGKRSDGRGRLSRGRRSPLIVATILMTFGWLLILLNADKRLVDTTGVNAQLELTTLLTPSPSAITYAFLGAYFFGINLVHHAYVRGDLRPKTYNLISTRILLVVILAWLIEIALPAGTSNVVAFSIAFAAGIIPRTVLHLLFETVRTACGPVAQRFSISQQVGQSVSAGDQLTALDGIDLYERTRLSDEGITTLQALANHDLVDLFFKTRIAAARLIDWVDQAALQLYLADATGDETLRDQETIRALRSIGVRTATDFILAHEDPSRRPCLTDALSAGVPDRNLAEARLAILARMLPCSEWVARIRHWRESDLTRVHPERRRHIDGTGTLRCGDPRLTVPATVPVPRSGADRSRRWISVLAQF